MGGVLNGKYPGKTKKKKGFTLIELIIVIAILGILALIAIPKFGSAQKDAKIKADIATAKTIADTTATLVADGTIAIQENANVDTQTIGTHMQGGFPTPQSEEGAFTVKLDKEGNITVKIGDKQFYPWEK
nr:prepilin-type N-terminal cleavage/methylation domain-containing protein [Clostridium novyi]